MKNDTLKRNLELNEILEEFSDAIRESISEQIAGTFKRLAVLNKMLLTPDDVSFLLGCNKSYIYDFCNQKLLHCVRFGEGKNASIRIFKNSVEEFVKKLADPSFRDNMHFRMYTPLKQNLKELNEVEIATIDNKINELRNIIYSKS